MDAKQEQDEPEHDAGCGRQSPVAPDQAVEHEQPDEQDLQEVDQRDASGGVPRHLLPRGRQRSEQQDRHPIAD